MVPTTMLWHSPTYKFAQSCQVIGGRLEFEANLIGLNWLRKRPIQ